ncbi:MAG: hypothetical protein ISR65_08990 [Bacteriovoracaceae bacterium]|nr:hypothetical protein [Bacteriovoracaceae bacterium]
MKKSSKKQNTDEKRWKEAASKFEKSSSLDLLALSEAISPEEHRKILGAGNRKAISLRIPENDLSELKKIATANGRKYQQLIIQAIELYIDTYYNKISKV